MLEKQSAKVILEECFLNFTDYKIDHLREGWILIRILFISTHYYQIIKVFLFIAKFLYLLFGLFDSQFFFASALKPEVR